MSSVRKANVWFSTLFGGGTVFPSGEDTMWLREAKHKGLVFYVSNQTIGEVLFKDSSWFTGRNEKYYYGQGAYSKAVYKKHMILWKVYYSFRTANNSLLSFKERYKWISNGMIGFDRMLSYDEFISKPDEYSK